MALAADPAIRFVLVLQRDLGCLDDTATDEEQYERVLFYHPNTTPLSEQLQTANLCEGLIDFTTRFADEPIDTVVMESSTYSFLKCEENLWIIAAVHNAPGSTSSEPPQNSSCVHENGLQRLLELGYSMFTMLYDRVDAVLHGSDGKAWDVVLEVKRLRKTVRKLLREHSVDAEDHCMEQAEARTETKRNRNNQRRSLEQRLQTLLAIYPCVCLRRRLRHFFHWFLSVQPFHRITTLNALQGIHYYPVGHPAFQIVTRLIFETKEALVSRGLRSCTVLYDGNVIWSELDEDTLRDFYEFVRLNELVDTVSPLTSPTASTENRRRPDGWRLSTRGASVKLRSIHHDAANAGFDQSKSRSPNVLWQHNLANNSEERTTIIPKPFEFNAHKWNDADRPADSDGIVDDADTPLHTGFICNGWVTRNDFQPRHAHDESVFAESSVGPYEVWCPRIYSNTKTLLGRLLAYRKYRFIFAYIFDDEMLSGPHSTFGANLNATVNGPSSLLSTSSFTQSNPNMETVIAASSEGSPVNDTATGISTDSASAAETVWTDTIDETEKRATTCAASPSEHEALGCLASPSPSSLVQVGQAQPNLEQKDVLLQFNAEPPPVSWALVEQLLPTIESVVSSLAPALENELAARPAGHSLGPVRLFYYNSCNFAFKSAHIIRDTTGRKYTVFRYPTHASRLASHLDRSAIRAIDDAFECFTSRNTSAAGVGSAMSPGQCHEFCVRISSSSWLFGRSMNERYVFFLLEEQSCFQEAYETMLQATRRIFGAILLM